MDGLFNLSSSHGPEIRMISQSMKTHSVFNLKTRRVSTGHLAWLASKFLISGFINKKKHLLSQKANMKKYLILITFIFFSSVASAAEYDLTLHHFYAPSEPSHTDVLVPWANKIKELTNGRVEIRLIGGMGLGGKPKDLTTQVRSGKVDLIWTVNGYSGKEFIRTEVFELPFVHTNDPVATNLAIREMFETDLKEDYQGMEVMFLHATQGHAFQSNGYGIRKPEDLLGKRARTPSRTGAWTLEALGAKPVSVPVKRLPQTIQRKVATTVMLPFTANPLLKLNQYITHMTEGHEQTRFGTVVFQVSMNQEKWNSLPSDIQAAFREASGEWIVRKAGQVWHDDEKRGLDLMLTHKKTHIVLNKEETEAFEIALQPVTERWIEDVKSQGIDGKALVAKAKRLVEKHSQR